jgi:hypothetical protein
MELLATKHFKFRNTKTDRPRPSFFITGPPAVGKTLLAAELALKVTGASPSDVLVVEFPMDEEGAETLRDREFVSPMISSIAALDELYETTKKAKFPAVIMDNMPAAWWMAYMDRHPDGTMPDDFGRSWNRLFADIAYSTITRFKAPSWVKFFAATSLVWAVEDAFTVAQVSREKGPKDEKLQTTLPGQLKGNIYGLFSYALNIKMGGTVKGVQMRVLETRSSSSVVAKFRAPLNDQPRATVMYDLATPEFGIDHIVKELKLGGSNG